MFFVKVFLFPFLFIRDTRMLYFTLHSWDQWMVPWKQVSVNPGPNIRLIISWHHLPRLLSVHGRLRWIWSIHEVVLTGKWKYSEKTLCHCHFFDTHCTWWIFSNSKLIFIHLHGRELSTAHICVEGLFLGLYTVWVMCFPTLQRNILHLLSGCLHLVCMDAEVVEKKGVYQLI
jgi:hypothetical protein